MVPYMFMQILGFVMKGDYRDQLPPTLEEVAAHYAPIVQDGKWTFGLLEMWGHKARIAKSAVHIPCWEAFSWNPFKWRGCCFGRYQACHHVHMPAH